MANGPRYKASIIVPTFDRVKTVTDTVHSLTVQTASRDDFEVIVVDDGSHDDTFHAVTTMGNKLNFKYVYQPDRGYRVSRARNLGIAVAEGDICVFVDAGNLAASGFVEQHIASHEAADGNIVAVGYTHGFFSMFDDQRVEDIHRILDPRDVDASIARFDADGTLKDRRERVYEVVNDDLSRAVAPWIYVFGGNFSARRDLVLQVGCFDEHYVSWGDEDMDIAFAMYDAGAKIVFNRKAAMIQTPHEKNRETRMASHRKNATYMHEKYKAHETGLFLKYGNRKMPILPGDPFPEI